MCSSNRAHVAHLSLLTTLLLGSCHSRSCRACAVGSRNLVKQTKSPKRTKPRCPRCTPCTIRDSTRSGQLRVYRDLTYYSLFSFSSFYGSVFSLRRRYTNTAGRHLGVICPLGFPRLFVLDRFQGGSEVHPPKQLIRAGVTSDAMTEIKRASPSRSALSLRTVASGSIEGTPETNVAGVDCVS